MTRLFGTDGIRGEAGAFPLDEKTVALIGRSLAKRMTERLGRQPKFATGRDTRESGQWIEREFHRGAIAGGAVCESAGVITTPGVAFLTAQFEFDLGVVISASHNPFHDNGIKAFLPSGRKIDDDLERLIENDIASGESVEIEQLDSVDTTGEGEFRKAYLEHLSAQGNDELFEGFTIAVDCANGAASKLAPHLFRSLGATVIALSDQPDGRNINAECGSLHLDKLQAKVMETGADLGVAFDGDADRALFVDEKGNVVDGDATLWIVANALLAAGELVSGKVIATVMSNIGLELALRSKNIELVRTSVGDKYVLEELLKSGAEIGGEQSGHIIFPKNSLVGDGMMTALMVFKTVAASGQPFSSAVEGFTRYPQILVNVKVGTKRPFDEVEAIAKASAETEKALAGNGRLLLRYSGTENLARVMIEGEDQEQIEGLANRLAATIKTALS